MRAESIRFPAFPQPSAKHSPPHPLGVKKQKSGLKEVLSVHLEEVNIDKEDNEQTWSGDLDSNVEQSLQRGTARTEQLHLAVAYQS